MTKLNNQDSFPTFRAKSVNHGSIEIPVDLDSEWVTLLFYRGEWWPYCRQQLADYQDHLDQFKELGIEVAAFSVDPREDAELIIDDLNLDYPVFYDLDCNSIADKTGIYYDRDNEFFHATGFLLKNDKVRQATYSSGPIGRMVAEDVTGLVEFYQSQ